MEEWLGLGRPAVRRATPWLIATAVLGLAFLAGQWMAWQQLFAQGVSFASNPTNDLFYLITGIHGAHLLVGLMALGAALAALFVFKRVEYRQIAVDCSAWYWHTMGVFWIFLFTMLAFYGNARPALARRSSRISSRRQTLGGSDGVGGLSAHAAPTFGRAGLHDVHRTRRREVLRRCARRCGSRFHCWVFQRPGSS